MKQCISCGCMIEKKLQKCIFCNAIQPQIEEKKEKPQINLRILDIEDNTFATTLSKDSENRFYKNMLDIAYMDRDEYEDFKENYAPRYAIHNTIKPVKKNKYDINYDGYYNNIIPVLEKTSESIKISSGKIMQMVGFIVATILILILSIILMLWIF